MEFLKISPLLKIKYPERIYLQYDGDTRKITLLELIVEVIHFEKCPGLLYFEKKSERHKFERAFQKTFQEYFDTKT